MTGLADPALETVVEDYRRRQASLERQALRLAAVWWRAMPRDWMDIYWRQYAPALAAALALLQEQAAAEADGYVDAALAAQQIRPDPGGRVNPAAFQGASDGREMMALLYQPLVAVKTLLGRGEAVPAAFDSGRARLLRIAETQVADAGRSAVGVRIASDRASSGYVRMASAGACARCAVLAGKEYAFNAGFARHLNCHCVHVPTTRARGRRMVSDPRDHFNALSRAEQDRIYTRHGAQAIRDGADITMVVNARRGITTADLFGRSLRVTSDSMTRRGLVAHRMKNQGYQGLRLTPEAIYKIAEDRDAVLRLLYRHGYLW